MLEVTRNVALRKESVDRNRLYASSGVDFAVALRKESVDRNNAVQIVIIVVDASLSARRAWIEIPNFTRRCLMSVGRSPQGERG